jgi:2-dehydropantoate 2-reductase
MRVCVVGAGAIGGLLAAKLAASGEQVTVIARGAHLEAIRSKGLRLIEATGEAVVTVAATDRIAEAGPQDLVILAVKAHQIQAIADGLANTFARNTVVLTAQNGIPWWYFLKGVTNMPAISSKASIPAAA